MKLLFVSNLFPDAAEPYRGLDNATLLHHLADRWEIRVLAVRPTLSPVRAVAAVYDRRTSPAKDGGGHRPPLQPWGPRAQDVTFSPQYIAAPYVPKIGSRWNHRLMARALRHRLRELRRQFAFDVVLSSWIFPDSCAIAELAQELDFPFVAIAQGSDVHQYLQMPIRRKIITRLLPRAAAVITRSAELARLLTEAGLPGERVHPIYNGVDLDLFHPRDRRAVRREMRLPADAPVILFVGNFYPIKNPWLPPLALASLYSTPFKVSPILVMVGGGEAEARIRSPANRALMKVMKDNVIFAGRTNASGVARYMQAADVLLLPSQNEGVPNVILEAFACGLPVVASRVGGIPEVHPGDDFGRLVQPIEVKSFASALREVLLAPPDATHIRQHARQFSWARAAAACHELLVQACR